jgi:NADH dehydrogenase (ubiquinone) 1 alpha subcomplex subunit 6
MYSLNMPVSALRTKMRQEFERHRYVNQVEVVDVLLFQSHSEFQVRWSLNYWKMLIYICVMVRILRPFGTKILREESLREC